MLSPSLAAMPQSVAHRPNSRPGEIEPLLTKARVAELLGCSIRCLESWISSGRIRVVRLGGGRLTRIEPAAVREFIDAARVADAGGQA